LRPEYSIIESDNLVCNTKVARYVFVFYRVGLFGNAVLIGDRFHLKLNISGRPIAKKYCEGKVKRTLKRELKVLEIVEREANVICNYGNLSQ